MDSVGVAVVGIGGLCIGEEIDGAGEVVEGRCGGRLCRCGGRLCRCGDIELIVAEDGADAFDVEQLCDLVEEHGSSLLVDIVVGGDDVHGLADSMEERTGKFRRAIGQEGGEGRHIGLDEDCLEGSGEGR